MKKQPLENCPVCQVPVKWILHDDLNSYDCSNEECPIKFTERVGFLKDTTDFDFKSGHGELFYYSFQVGDYPVVIYFGGLVPKIMIYPTYAKGGLADASIIINQPVEINWQDLELLKHRIRTWITFS